MGKNISSSSRNFVPSVRCPHCNKATHAEISGWGRTGLNVRYHTCKYCNEDFNLVVHASVSKKDEDVSDGQLSSIKSSIKWEKERRKKLHERLLKELQAEREATAGINN